MPHYTCVSRRTPQPEHALKFLNFLMSEPVARYLVKAGDVVGRQDLDVMPPPLRQAFAKGKAEAYKTEETGHLLNIIHSNLRRWRSGDLSVSDAVGNIMRRRAVRAVDILNA